MYFPQYDLNSDERFEGLLFGKRSFSITAEKQNESFAAKNEQTQNPSADGIKIIALNATPLSAKAEYA